MKRINIVDADVKRLGRTIEYNGNLWSGLSATGITFKFSGKSLAVNILGDDNTALDESQRVKADDKADPGFARLGIFVGDECIFAECIKNPTQKIEIVKDKQTEDIIRIIKLSESPMSLLGFESLEMDDDASIEAVASKAKKIEIIGDSITCGYGVEGNDALEPFSTATENVSMAHSYMTAKALDLDYSIVSYSGYGLISGYTEGDVPITEQLLPNYYDMVGHSYGTVDQKKITEVPYDHSSFVADVTVVNLGTNDESYCREFEDRRAGYIEKYIAFVKHLREVNPTTHIILAYGIMTGMFVPLVEEVAKRYTEETGDDNISTLKYTTHTEADGYGCDYHPSAYSQKRAASELISEVEKYI